MLGHIGQSLLFALTSIVLLRIAGRKSISQMTMPQIGILLTIGSIVGSEVSGKGIGKSIAAAAVFIAVLIAVEWLTLRSNTVEKFLKGVAIPVVVEGQVLTDSLRRLRISVDDLEKRLRMKSVANVQDVKIATIEVNGELGLELFPHARPVTSGEIEALLKAYLPQTASPSTSTASPSLFTEVLQPQSETIPPQLQ
ncbi:uncharacterized membrane protein YcaP (DUF421 family) [Paenibacillus phyllosphaerae]|uniref:Uncharacterized membrane protein YcaP (DUF421 family) n=1 Tax=Paenibacillus phyllosphaerae TaxID=274593 RepID=A0A7W5B5E0_9BACL|nr:YetF domain-containing protein [Paenibacillus phyllosphaerae]MBB3114738.1 uncharacterized membrane protein YcaP (DUF421 family) [Paenibacillus phyllosphaerae]